MRSIHFHLGLTLCSTLVTTACPGNDPATESGSSTTTAPGETTEPGPTTGTTGPEPTTGTTEPEPTTGTTGSGTTGEPVEPEIEALCQADDAALDLWIDMYCACLVAAGDYDNLEACHLDLDFPTDMRECTCDVHAMHPEMKAYYDCYGPPFAAYNDCYAAAGCLADAEAMCDAAYEAAVVDCPAYPSATAVQVEADCYGIPPFLCGSGEQVVESARCDITVDCMDGSDEADCTNQFTCDNGSQIFIDDTCDGDLDCCAGETECPDPSDEAGCPQFMCTSGESIPTKLQCDVIPHCEDGSDEIDCPTFECTSGETIPEIWKCDDYDDCRDGSDELNCP